MSITRSDVPNIAKLARIAVDEQDITSFTRSLSDILQLVAQMNEIDTTGIEPMSHPLDLPQRCRPDEVTEFDQRTLFQKPAPLVEDGYYLVPKVIEND